MVPLGLTTHADASVSPPVPLQATQVVDLGAYALQEATRLGVNPTHFYNTLQCESHFNPEAVGDGGTSYGVAQIHLPAHPEVSKEEALDPEWAITWAAQQFANGKAEMWSCWRLLYK